MTKSFWLLKQCGTEAAYRRHRRNSEKADQQCLAAAALAQAIRRERRGRSRARYG